MGRHPAGADQRRADKKTPEDQVHQKNCSRAELLEEREVVVQLRLQNSIETFASMRAKLVKTPERLLELACADCDALARAGRR